MYWMIKHIINIFLLGFKFRDLFSGKHSDLWRLFAFRTTVCLVFSRGRVNDTKKFQSKTWSGCTSSEWWSIDLIGSVCGFVMHAVLSEDFLGIKSGIWSSLYGLLLTVLVFCFCFVLFFKDNLPHLRQK